MWNSKLLSALRDKYYSLTRREKFTLASAGIAVVVILLVQFVIFPMNDSINRLRTSVADKERDLLELKSIAAQYKRLDSIQGDRAEKDASSFNLFSVLEKIATQSGLMDKIDYMKPGELQLDGSRLEKWVEVKLSRITLKEFTTYLYNLRLSGKGIYVKRLSSRKEGDYLSLTLQPAVVEIR